MEQATGVIQDFLAEYYRAFAAGDYARIAAEMYRAPVTMTTDEQVDVFRDTAEVEAMFKQTGEALVADGYSHSEMLAAEISVLNQSTAFAATRFRRVRKDGSIIVEAGATYQLLQEEGRWRIHAALLHPADRVLALR